VLHFSLSGVLFQGFAYSFSGRQREQQLENEKIELEMNLVRSQLNPHFLFNVLNNIDHYIRKDPDKASHSIIKLSSMLRYLLYESSQQIVPLNKEVAFLEEYIELQKQRIGQGNTCTFRKEISDPGLMVVPALFLPFFENAFSHCPLNQPGNFLYFELIGIPGKITFVGRNTRQMATAQSERKGLGLNLARKRLALLYPDTHQLHILETEHHFSIELVLEVK
jgi:LytS/YehU family sensor histidine kinase